MELISIAKLLATKKASIPSITSAIENAIAEELPAIYTIDGMGRCVEEKNVDQVLRALWVLWDTIHSEGSGALSLASLPEDRVRDIWHLSADDPLPVEWVQAKAAADRFKARMSMMIEEVPSEYEPPPDRLDVAFQKLESCGWLEENLPEAITNFDSSFGSTRAGTAKRDNTFFDIMLALAESNPINIEEIHYKSFEKEIVKVRPNISSQTLRPILDSLRIRLKANRKKQLRR